MNKDIVKATIKAVRKGHSTRYTDAEYKQILSEARKDTKESHALGNLFLLNQLRQAMKKVI